eukprot:TRINITY_DN10267_c0_g1_i2.p2 TRINITY_DN10267_c0_g1~~TRINITY_DN10267_c0_g1_i2.p2  ORF type:complete len:106 (-),score=1.90 TRINITY_DN10267_c0_g1_i2:222-539(-)
MYQFHKIEQDRYQRVIFFFTRAENNMRFRRMYSKVVDKKTGVRYDQIGNTQNSRKDYPDKLQRLSYFDEGRNKDLVFISNNFDLKPPKSLCIIRSSGKLNPFSSG